MKKKIGLIMSMVLLFVFVFSGINNTYVAHAEKNNDFVIGTHNLNNTEKNSAKVGDMLREPEIGWKRYDDKNTKILKIGPTGNNPDSPNYLGDAVWISGENVNSKFKFTFTGTKLRILAIKNAVGLVSSIKIDDKTYEYSHFDPSIMYQRLVFEKIDLSNTIHKVEISLKNPGTSQQWIWLDAIDIDEAGSLLDSSESITLDKTSMDLLEGSSDNLNAKVLPEDATNKKVVWSSSDEKIATVDKDGKVTAIKEGKATITAKVEGTDLTATCKVNVTKKVEENKNNAILSISLVNGATKEYDVNMQEVEKFINWFEERSNGKGSSLYSFDKKINPYKTVKEYIVHDKIASFEVREYEGTNK
ncbi:Ig-like domain-containing protein [Clostridium botulinum]|uniref:Ig-like domain-containing protein n=1 Tax=Clostridium botulinum TaxID=1491 RepID=UPI001FD668F8|nr:Ig-like domain-containing protein [Clostridium botulinum]MCJ8173021.1 Ig-like domain-containing protein [Clostridium botulinum]